MSELPPPDTPHVPEKQDRLATLVAWLLGMSPELLEFVQGLASSVVGMWLLSPAVDPFQRYPSLTAVLRAIAPAWAWGTLALTLGAIKLVATGFALEGLSRTSRRDLRALLWIRLASAGLGIFLWLFVGTSLAQGDIRSFSVFICLLVFAPGSLLLFLCLYLRLQDARQSARRSHGGAAR